MDMIQQIFAQAQAGSAQGEGFGQFAVQGAHLGQNQQRLNMAQREQDMLLPLRIKEMQANNLLLQFKAQEVDRMMTQRVQNEGAYQQLAQMLDERITAGEVATPETATALMAHMARYPGLMQDPRSQGLLKLYNDSMEMTLRLKQQVGQAPSSVKEFEYEKQLAQQAGTPMSPQEQLDRYRANNAPSNTVMRSFGPDGQVTSEFISGKGGQATAGGLTTPNVTHAQQRISAAEQVIGLVNDLEPLMSGETIGIPSAIMGQLNDRLLAQVPGLERYASEDRAKATVLATELESTLSALLKVDGQMAEPERRMITRPIPKPETWNDSPQRAKFALKQIKKGAAKYGMLKSFKLGTPITSGIAKSIEDTDLLEMLDSGFISKDQVLAVHNARKVK
jgi:hypothetical protein